MLNGLLLASGATALATPTPTPIPIVTTTTAHPAPTVLVAPTPSATDPMHAAKGIGEFAAWRSEVEKEHAAQKIRDLCAGTLTLTGEKASSRDAWCHDYGPGGAKVDMPALLDSELASLAAFMRERPTLKVILIEGGTLIQASSEGKKFGGRSTFVSVANGVAAVPGLPGTIGQAEIDAFMTNLFEGLALAIKDRAEQEAVAYLLEQVQTNLCTGDMVFWLPETCIAAAEGAFGGTAESGGQAAIELLRRTLADDLRALPARFAHVAIDTAAPDLQMGPDIERLVSALIDGTPPIAAFDHFADGLSRAPDFAKSDEKQMIACSAHLPAGLLEAVPEVTTAMQGLPGLSDAEVDSGVMALVILDAPCAPLVVPTSGIAAPGASLAQQRAASEVRLGLLATKLASLDGLGHRIGAAIAAVSKIEHEIEGVRAAGGSPDSATIAELARVTISSANDLLDAFSGMLVPLETLDPALIRYHAHVTETLVAARSVLRILALAVNGDIGGVYQELLAHAAPAVTLEKLDETLEAKCEKGDAALAARDFGAALREYRTVETGLVAEKPHGFCARRENAGQLELVRARVQIARVGTACTGPCVAIPAPLVRYGGMIVAIATAKTPEDVKGAILAAASPPGSWRMKTSRAARPVVTLGGLAGVGFVSAGNRDTGELKYKNKLGVLVPFGVDWVPQHAIHVKRWEMPVGVFVQLLELGNFAATENQPKPRWLQGVSPGAGLKIVPFRSPLAIYAGAAYDLDDGAPTAHARTRFFAGITVDATLFVLHRH